MTAPRDTMWEMIF